MCYAQEEFDSLNKRIGAKTGTKEPVKPVAKTEATPIVGELRRGLTRKSKTDKKAQRMKTTQQTTLESWTILIFFLANFTIAIMEP